MYSVRINRLHWKPSIIKSLTVLNSVFFFKVEMVLRANKAVSKIHYAFRFSPPEGRHLCLQHVHRVTAEIALNPLLISFLPSIVSVVCWWCVLPVCCSMQKCSHVLLKKYECVRWDLLQTAMYLPRCSQLGLFVVFFSGLIPANHDCFHISTQGLLQVILYVLEVYCKGSHQFCCFESHSIIHSLCMHLLFSLALALIM